jgi:hypothetical protein
VSGHRSASICKGLRGSKNSLWQSNLFPKCSRVFANIGEHWRTVGEHVPQTFSWCSPVFARFACLIGRLPHGVLARSWSVPVSLAVTSFARAPRPAAAMDEFLALEYTGFAQPLPEFLPVPGGLLRQRSLLTEDLIVWSKCRWLLIWGTCETFGVCCRSCFV